MLDLLRAGIALIICGVCLYTLANAQASTPGAIVFGAWILVAISGAWAVIEIARWGTGG
mgnify:FL=1|nr:MAG TPA: hypothetical protein [Caudoviricetes sp.]